MSVTPRQRAEQKKTRPLSPRVREAQPRAGSSPLGRRGTPPPPTPRAPPRARGAQPRAGSAPIGGRGTPPARAAPTGHGISPAALKRRVYRQGTKAILSSSNPFSEVSHSERPRTQLLTVLDSLRLGSQIVPVTVSIPEGNLPSSAPGNLEHCEEGCYWRWFVQTVADDVNTLRANLDETQGALQQRSEERREREQVIEHQDLLRAELADLEGKLASLRLEAPKLREEHAHLDAQAVGSGLAILALQDRKDELSRELEADRAKQHILVADAEEWERKAKGGREAERLLHERVIVLKDNDKVLQSDLLQMTTERDQLRQEVEDLNNLREKQGRRGRKRKPKPKKPP